MKTKKEIKEKEFDTVTTFRKIKEQISKDLAGKSFEEIKRTSAGIMSPAESITISPGTTQRRGISFSLFITIGI
jgi:hypothetical protein